MISLFRTNTIWRPLSIYVKNNQYELDDIVFFNENGVITNIGSGFFNDDKERDFKGTCIKKIKKDFTMKDNFIIKDTERRGEIRYILYIYEKNVNISFLGKDQLYFGDIYSHWKVNDYDFWKYERTLKDNLCKLNDKAEQIIKELGGNFGYNKKGLTEIEFNTKVAELRKVNKKILKEVENINNYVIE